MSITRTNSIPRSSAVIAVVGIHALMFYALSTGLNVTKITQPLESMVTVFLPQEKPASPPLPKAKLPDAELEQAIPEPEPVIPAPPETDSVPVESPEPPAPAPASTFSIKYRVDPQYPAAAKRAGEQGTVLLELIVAPDGRPSEVNILRSSGFPVLDQAAVDAVRKWRFATNATGLARLQLPVTFKLEQG